MASMLPRTPLQPLMDAVERLAALDTAAGAVARAVRRATGSGTRKEAISGTWLGNTLHAPLTDVVIGPLASASLVDLLAPESPRAAQRLTEAGLLFALPTALAGLNDWADSEAADAGIRRAGLLHAAGTTSGLALYAASVVARRRGAQRRGARLALAGLGVVTAAGYLGGHMSFRRGIGPNQTAFDRGPAEWTALEPGTIPTNGRPQRELAGDTPVLLLRRGDAIHAIHDRCSHRGCSLAGGEVDGHVVTCPCHGSRFDVRDGAVLGGPATYPQPAFDVRRAGDRLEVRLRPR